MDENASGLWPSGGEVFAEAVHVFATTFGAVAGNGLLYGAAAAFVAALVDGWIFDRKSPALSRALSHRASGAAPVVFYRAGGTLYLLAGMSAVAGCALVGLSGARLWANGPMLIAGVLVGVAGGVLEAHRALSSQAHLELRSLLQEGEIPSLAGYGRRGGLGRRLAGQLAERVRLFEAASLNGQDVRAERITSARFAATEALFGLFKAETKTPRRQRSALNYAMRNLRFYARQVEQAEQSKQALENLEQGCGDAASDAGAAAVWKRAQAVFDVTLARYAAYELDVEPVRWSV